MIKTEPQKRLESFLKEFNKTEVKIKDIERLKDLISDFIMRTNQFVEEARESRTYWKDKYLEEKNETKKTKEM